MNQKSKAVSALLLTLEAAAIIALLSALNILVFFCNAFAGPVFVGMAIIGEGILLWLGSRKEHDTLPICLTILCAFAPSPLISLIIYLNHSLFYLYSMFYFLTSVGIAVVGVISAALTAIFVKLKIL
ncbi:MAG: hypothetical protein K2N56_07445 [Oscillospiraceae bacterium]|nr:hypothetical protein [Oscillospiraceae bacterium]